MALTFSRCPSSMNCSRSFANRQSSLGRKRYLAFAKKRDDRFGKRETSVTRQRRGLPLLNQFRAARCCVDACLRISFATRKAKATSECFGLTFPSYPPPTFPSTLHPSPRRARRNRARSAARFLRHLRVTCSSLFPPPFLHTVHFRPGAYSALARTMGEAEAEAG